MYRLKFYPRFLHYKRELLAQKITPPIPLPQALEDTLSTTSPLPTGTLSLWFETIQAIQPFLWSSVKISCLSALCATAAAAIAMRLLEPNQLAMQLGGLALAYFVASALGQVCIMKNNQYRNWASLATQGILVNFISRKLLQMSSKAAARQSTGNLKVLLTSDTLHVAEFFDNVIRNLIPSIIGLIVVFPLLIYLIGKPGLAGIMIMILFLPLSFGLNYVSMLVQKRGQEALDALASILGEWIKNVRLVRYLSWDDAFQLEIQQRVRRYISFSTLQHLMLCLIFGLSVSWWMVSVVGVFAVAHISGHPLDLLKFFGSLWLITFLAGYFIHVPNTIRLFGLAAPSMQRIARLLNEEDQDSLLSEAENPDPSLHLKTPVSVIFKDVSFSYDTPENALQSGDSPLKDGLTVPPKHRAIRNVSVEVDLKQKLAIIGEVACGKTTFLKLLCGELPPTQGTVSVKFDDGSIHDLWTKQCHPVYRRHIAWVPQEPFVSSDPLSSNISLISSQDETALMEAAYWAELEADIQSFPAGIHEEIGEGGVNLSGGQKQRLNIARAYFSNRSYLALDDSLSALDTSTETALMKRLELHSKGYILVTHRTAEISRVEHVLIMKNGAFIESGSPGFLASNPSSQFSQVLSAYERWGHP